KESEIENLPAPVSRRSRSCGHDARTDENNHEQLDELDGPIEKEQTTHARPSARGRRKNLVWDQREERRCLRGRQGYSWRVFGDRCEKHGGCYPDRKRLPDLQQWRLGGIARGRGDARNVVHRISGIPL